MNVTNNGIPSYTENVVVGGGVSADGFNYGENAASRQNADKQNASADKLELSKDYEKHTAERKSFIEQMNEALRESQKKLDPKKIARKIARGQKVSERERAYLEKTDPVLYKKALAANESRRMTEAQIRTAKTEEELKKALTTAKVMCAGIKDADLGELSIEGVKELEERYLQKKRQNKQEHNISLTASPPVKTEKGVVL